MSEVVRRGKEEIGLIEVTQASPPERPWTWRLASPSSTPCAGAVLGIFEEVLQRKVQPPPSGMSTVTSPNPPTPLASPTQRADVLGASVRMQLWPELYSSVKIASGDLHCPSNSAGDMQPNEMIPGSVVHLPYNTFDSELYVSVPTLYRHSNQGDVCP